MRKQVAKKIWQLAASIEQRSTLVKGPDGSVKWEGFARLYKNMKKAYKAGKGRV